MMPESCMKNHITGLIIESEEVLKIADFDRIVRVCTIRVNGIELFI